MLDVLTFEWDLDGDGQYDDASQLTGPSPQTSGGSHSIAAPGVYPLGVRVSDGDGGVATSDFELSVGVPPGVPSLLPMARIGLMIVLTLAGFTGLWRSRRDR